VFLKLIGKLNRPVGRIGADDMARHAEIDVAAVAFRAPPCMSRKQHTER
jgi:hypothetical protein